MFTELDLRSAYSLVRIHKGDERKTSFITNTGQYEYLLMPYGSVNSPSIFQAVMYTVFWDMVNQFLVVYIDDILIYSSSLSQNICNVRLQKLQNFHLFAKAEKCEFYKTQVQFLGYVIHPGEVAT